MVLPFDTTGDPVWSRALRADACLSPDPYASSAWRYQVHQRIEELLGERHDLREALAMMLGLVEAESTNAAYHRRSKVRQLIAADAQLRKLLEECP